MQAEDARIASLLESIGKDPDNAALHYELGRAYQIRGKKLSALEAYQHALKANRYATGEDFLRMVRLAAGIPEIVTVGNGVHYLKEADGRDVPPKMVAIKGAALFSKSSKGLFTYD